MTATAVLEFLALMDKLKLDPDRDLTVIKQGFTMDPFLAGQMDAASAMTYNELAQVLETKNPKTGRLYQLRDLNVITMEKAGTAMLEDGIFVRGDWLEESGNVDVAKRFVAASLKGWAWCRDHVRDCTNIVLKNGPTLGRGHQLWQMNEINKLIWPAPLGVGVMSPTAFARTAAISKQFKVIAKPATKAAYRTDIARGALGLLRPQKVDVTGKKWKAAVVKVTVGGK